MSINQICMDAFENDHEVIRIGNLAITNHPDVITLEGILHLTKDQKGLEYAFALKRQIDTIVEKLKREDLPPSLTCVNTSLLFRMIQNPNQNKPT